MRTLTQQSETILFKWILNLYHGAGGGGDQFSFINMLLYQRRDRL
jgi:hypothetical protein